MKLKHKLFAGYFAVTALALILCLLALNGYRTIHTHFAAVTQDILPGQQAMVDAKQSALAIVVESRDYLRTGDEIHARYARENMDDLQESLHIHREHETHVGEEEKGVAEELERRGFDLIELCNDLIVSYQRGAGEEELSEDRENIRLGKDELFELLDAHLLVHEQELTEAQNAIYQTIVTGFRVFAATNVVIWVLGWVIARYSARSILEPIRKLETGAGIIGGGDLDHRLDIKTGDEIEQLAAAFNGMANRLADMVDNLEQRVAERTRDLRASEERFRDVAESSADWIWEVDAAGCYTYCSENIVNVLGYTPEDILGKTPLDLMPPEEATRVSQVFAGIAADKRPIVDLENRNLTRDGREVVLLTNGAPILDSEGNLLGYRGVDQDITERVRAEEELQKIKEGLEKQNVRLETLYHVGQMVNSTLDTETILARLTDEAMRITRATHGQVLVVQEESGCFERCSLRGFSPEEAELARTLPLALDKGINGRAYTTHQAAHVDDVQADPAYFPLISTTRAELAVPIIRDGQVLGNLDLQGPEAGAFRDVDLDYLNALTDQVAIALANARLYQAEQRGREVAEALQETVRVVNTSLKLDQVLSLILEQLEQVIRYDSSAVLLLDDGRLRVTAGRGFPDLEAILQLSFGADEEDVSVAVMRTRRPLIIEDVQSDPRWQAGPETAHVHGWIGAPLIVRDKVIGVLTADNCRPGAYNEEDGQLVFAFANQAAAAIENARLYETVQRELTERQRAERRLQHYAAELEQANEEVKQFAYIVSHDLRAPLVNLKGFAAELRTALTVVGSATITTLPHLDEKRRPAVTMALQEDVPEALGFIDSSVTRMDHFIKALLKLSRLGRRQLDFEPIDMNVLVQATLGTLAHQIERCQVKMTVGRLPKVVADRTSMEQIMGNLLNNAVLYLDPDRPGEIKITAESSPDETTFRVHDNGRGIAERDMDKVFAPFRRAGRQDVPGEGMGLPYVQVLVRRHGGRIWVESELGKGSTFYFTISADVKRET